MRSSAKSKTGNQTRDDQLERLNQVKSAISLRACYAMSGTDPGYGAVVSVLAGTDLGYGVWYDATGRVSTKLGCGVRYGATGRVSTGAGDLHSKQEAPLPSGMYRPTRSLRPSPATLVCGTDVGSVS
eukprot:286314-Rhodomonas_salina.1